ncbi:hypothetical protein [Parvibaculum sp.]|uniref:hypothetical protein n=1 Tax=Parvibaculum sp. TaxID=2024848 RepID=UPI00320FFCAF
MIVPAVDLTSTWIPLGILGVLVLYMIHLFMRERRVSKELLAAETLAPAAAPAPAEATPVAAPAVEPVPVETRAADPVSIPVVEVAKDKSAGRRSLVWRTAWIWLPFIIGFGGQAYLDHKPVIDPMIDPLLQKLAS